MAEFPDDKELAIVAPLCELSKEFKRFYHEERLKHDFPIERIPINFGCEFL